jgi:hypothetical protein
LRLGQFDLPQPAIARKGLRLDCSHCHDQFSYFFALRIVRMNLVARSSERISKLLGSLIFTPVEPPGRCNGRDQSIVDRGQSAVTKRTHPRERATLLP